MKKRLNPFAAFLAKNTHMGMFVNKAEEGGDGDDSSGIDQPGGLEDGSNAGAGNAGSGGMGGGVDEDGERQGGMDAGADSGDKGKKDDAGDKGKKDDAGDAGGQQSGESGTADIDTRFTALEGKIADLMNALSNNSNSGNDGKGDTGGQDAGMLDLEHDDLVAMMADDPSEFLSKLTATIEQSVTDKVMRENADNEFNSKIEKTIDSYADANPDFEKMWDSGDLKTYMDKNPGHNAMSAHLMLTMEQRIADAKKEGAEEAMKNFRTKANSQVLNGGHGISPDQKDAALKNPNKFGGAAAVIAARAGIQ